MLKQQEEQKDEEVKYKKKPVVPDETKWDVVYCLPFFGKPGRHTYLIKFKNTKERAQQTKLSQILKLQNQQRAENEQ